MRTDRASAPSAKPLVPNFDAVIIGGGLAGIACAVELSRSGASFLLLEASDHLGGRVRTDEVDGFCLDRGFQTLLTSYPEASRALNYPELELGYFRSGLILRSGGRFHKLADPWRNVAEAVPALFSAAGTFADKLRLGRLRARVCSGSVEEIFQRPNTTTMAALERAGFSSTMIESFFRPFLNGIFLESELVTSSRKFEFVFRMLALGQAALPARGMEAIPRQMAATLPKGSARINARVAAVEAGRVRMQAGEVIESKHIVLATAEPDAARLLGRETPRIWCSAACVYFDVAEPPVRGPWLVFNGGDGGPVNTLCVPSEACPEYAPAGTSLLCATVAGNPSIPDADLEATVRAQLTDWYGPQVSEWQTLRIYRIPYALPLQQPRDLEPVIKPSRIAGGLYVCGDYTGIASIQGAMASGRRAANAILQA
jgi:phytoene dehydrogenase-like protein